MSEIEKVHARQILDSRGNPTVEVDVTLASGATGRRRCRRAPRPGEFEAVELRDGGEAWGGKGVSQAVANANGELAEAVTGLDAADQEAVDRAMLELPTARPTRAAWAPTPSSASRSPPPRPPPPTPGSRSGATSAARTPTCCRCR